MYAQVANNIPIGDSTGSIIFNLDPDYEVISYEQTFAGTAEVQGNSRTVISQKRAVEALYCPDGTIDVLPYAESIGYGYLQPNVVHRA